MPFKFRKVLFIFGRTHKLNCSGLMFSGRYKIFEPFKLADTNHSFCLTADKLTVIIILFFQFSLSSLLKNSLKILNNSLFRLYSPLFFRTFLSYNINFICQAFILKFLTLFIIAQYRNCTFPKKICLNFIKTYECKIKGILYNIISK